MHVERLVIEAGSGTFSLNLHPCLTVIAGVGPLEREGLVNEIVASLGPCDDGVHLEVATGGRRLTVFRPRGGHHCVVDVDTAEVLTERYLDGQGRVDLLAGSGLTVRAARRQMRLGAEDLQVRSTTEDWLLGLARVDQHRLWDVAEKVALREWRHQELAEAAEAEQHDTAAAEEIERRHAAFEQAEIRLERVRTVAFLVAAAATVAVVPGAAVWGLDALLPLVVVALAATAISIRQLTKLQQARRRETEALEAAGIDSYVSFQIGRANSLAADDQRRRELEQAAEFHQSALTEWEVLAGAVPIDWAVEHQAEIRAAAAELRASLEVRNPMATTLDPEEGLAADLGHALQHRLDAVRRLGLDGESFPLLVDEPFDTLGAETVDHLLQLLVTASADQQVVLLTDDPDVAAWAHTEARSVPMAVVEPAASSIPNTVNDTFEGDEPRPDGSRHVAA
ncbi:MAG: hypothetical protein MUF83_17750 [Acidimicrobiales bacterium]|nr:hypothetical protein [Acidimicrobiales bacterium]